MGSIQLLGWNMALELDRKRRKGIWEKVTAPAARRMFERNTGRLPIPGHLPVLPAEVGGIGGLWMGEPRGSKANVILYLHGGGYVLGSAKSHLNLTVRFAEYTQASLFSADYRLAPEFPFPIAVEDALAAYRGLLETTGPESIAIAGDSAGGGLALATLLMARDQGLPMPAAAILFSPWTDLSCSGTSHRSHAATDVMILPEELPMMARFYLQGESARQAYASPLHAEDLSGLPPMLLHAGSKEMLLDDTIRLAEKVNMAGGDAEYEVWKNTPHVWQIFAGWLPEADQSLKKATSFLFSHWKSID